MNLDKFHFQYTSSLQGRRIRLLSFRQRHCPDRDLPLEVHLSEHSLDVAEFDALSYVWGDSHPKRRLICNGKHFDVRESLYEALIEYRHRHCNRRLWADAICINQNDDVEKTEQVRLMSDVYGTAMRTIIWLGRLQPDDEKAIRLVELVYNKTQRDNSQRPVSGTNEDFDFKTLDIPNVRNIRQIDPSWKALFQILRHPWFSRVWVIQELVLSSNPSFWRGEKSVDVHHLMWIAFHVGTKRNLSTAFGLINGFSSLPALGMANYFYNSAVRNRREKLPIWFHLMNSLGMKATDLRDRFFAIAGISAGLWTHFVDYSRTLEQVLSQVGLMSIIEGHQILDFEALDALADYPSITIRSASLHIPSWVPNFFSDQLRGIAFSRHYSTNSLRRTQGFMAAEIQIIVEDPNRALQHPITPSAPYLYHKVRELHMKALVFDKIKSMIPLTDMVKAKTSKFPREEKHPLSALQAGWDDAHELAISTISFVHRARLLAEPHLRNQDVMSGATFNAFWRTLLYNRTEIASSREQEPEDSFGMSFGYWYLLLKLFCTKLYYQDCVLFMTYWMILRPHAYPFKNTFDQIYGNRCFFVSEGGRLGWAPAHARCGDSLALFQGCRIPFAARLRVDDIWEYVGGCYVHGCMNGEIWRLEHSSWSFYRFA
ncbi:Putative heterokaryon incompatibility [Colletotrichum destructivum]|uniref:Heterokaryon incompatibility n=1 Tax=Colletotrichum destructivum TaxID=34406 RepID=A0AAX4IC49_9PEZI|nr:Putative heterokaryon incompatibility [Colletotrichum destructivum]